MIWYQEGLQFQEVIPKCQHCRWREVSPERGDPAQAASAWPGACVRGALTPPDRSRQCGATGTLEKENQVTNSKLPAKVSIFLNKKIKHDKSLGLVRCFCLKSF